MALETQIYSVYIYIYILSIQYCNRGVSPKKCMIKESPHHLTCIVVVDMFVIRKAEDMAHKPGQTTLSIAHITFWLVVGTFFLFPYIGNFIIPTDELIFFGGVETTNQIRCETTGKAGGRTWFWDPWVSAVRPWWAYPSDLLWREFQVLQEIAQQIWVKHSINTNNCQFVSLITQNITHLLVSIYLFYLSIYLAS